MNDEYEYDEGSDIDNWEDEQVFQDSVVEREEDDDDLAGSDAFEDWRDDDACMDDY